jgi:hypothetical protein
MRYCSEKSIIAKQIDDGIYIHLDRVITKLPSNLPKGKAKLLSQQPENRNGPDLVQAFPKKWWVESDFMAPNLLLPLQLNVMLY